MSENEEGCIREEDGQEFLSSRGDHQESRARGRISETRETAEIFGELNSVS